MRNHEVTTVQPLLKEDGTLTEPGWSKQLLQVYDRSAIKAPKYRIKEWDYYLVISNSGQFGVAFKRRYQLTPSQYRRQARKS